MYFDHAATLVCAVYAVGLAVGLLVGWGVFSRRPAKPAPEPERLPPGVEFGGPGMRARYQARAEMLARQFVALAYRECGRPPHDAAETARASPTARLVEKSLTDFVACGWVEGARDLADGVKRASPLPPGVTARLLDIGVKAARQGRPTG